MGPKKNWTTDEDLVLLRQVNADLPFKAKKGDVMDAWNELAVTISGVSGFARVVDGKKLQNRFIALLKEHAGAEKVSARASGVSESYDEKRELLDTLSSLVEDHKVTEAARSEEEKKKKEEDVAAGVHAREAAMEALGKRKNDQSDQDSPAKKNKLATMIGSLAEETGHAAGMKHEELELRKLELEERRAGREEARREREEDRKERLRLAEMERDKTMALLSTLMTALEKRKET